MPRPITAFVYGLFMDPELLRSKATAPEGIRAGEVTNFALRVGARAALMPSAGNRAYGMLMELTHEELERLYDDASLRPYRPEAVLVKTSDGAISAALCYNLPDPPAPNEHNPD